jgi:hypothetical protein
MATAALLPAVHITRYAHACLYVYSTCPYFVFIGQQLPATVPLETLFSSKLFFK